MEPEKRSCGAVTVSERGQIVVPAEARRDYNIQPGDRFLGSSDLDRGIAFASFDTLRRTMAVTMDLLREVGPAVPGPAVPAKKKR